MTVATIKDFEAVFYEILSSLMAFAAITLFIMLLVGGFRRLMSGEDPKAVEGAQKTITYAIGGLVILLLSYTIFLIIKAVTGVDATIFKITI